MLWFGSLNRVDKMDSPSNWFASPTGKRELAGPSTRWMSYITCFAWSRLRNKPVELLDVVINCKVYM